MPQKYYKLAAVLIFVLLSVLYYHKMIFWNAEGIHNWAQADRLSLAENFYTDGMNFFKPSTYDVYENPNGNVGVECPVQSYGAAVVGKIFGKADIPLAFRLITLLLTLLSCYILFCWTYKLSNNFFTALIPPIFFFTMPIGAYYGAGFLPDSFSLSLLIASFYFLFKFFNASALRFLIFSLLTGTLAVLVKMSTAVFFAGILIQAFSFILFSENKKKRLQLVVFFCMSLLCLLIIAAQYEYILYLDNRCHSTLFLASPKPLPLSFHDIGIAMITVFHQHISEYFSAPQILFIPVAFAGVILSAFYTFKKFKYYYSHFALTFTGALIAFILMGKQFYLHQYYVIAIIYPLIIFLVVLFTIILVQLPRRLTSIGSAVLIILFVIFGHQTFKGLLNDSRGNFWGENIGSEISRAGIKPYERVLIAGGPAPNLGLLFAERKGIAITIEESYKDLHSTIYFLRNHHLNYLVIGHRQHDTINKIDSCFLKYLRLVYKGEESYIYAYNGTREDKIWKQEIPGNHSSLLRYTTSFEYPDSCEPASASARTGKYAFEFSAQKEFMSPLNISNQIIRQLNPISFRATCWVKADYLIIPFFLVLTSTRNDTILQYSEADISPQLKIQPGWQQIVVDSPFLRMNVNADFYSFYFWNPNGSKYALDDFTIDLK